MWVGDFRFLALLGMTRWWDCFVFTLTLALSHQGRGGKVVGVVLFTRVALPPLWIDESLITLCQRVRFQRRRTMFFIGTRTMNGRVKSAMTVCATHLPHRHSRVGGNPQGGVRPAWSCWL